MCGIAGIAGTLAPDIAETRVRRMMADMSKRGPDSEGLLSWPGAVLGHRRLAIFDLSESGRQPMTSPDGQIGVVFNGAIYNFHSLRADLERRTGPFRSRADTEVLVRGYAVWGIDGLVERLRGMFAFGLWDARSRKLYLVRDRLGVKPVAYAITGEGIAFASTVRALHQAGFSGGLDPQAVLELLEFGYITDARSIYLGIGKLPAATILEWSGGGIGLRRYWELPRAEPRSPHRFDEVVDRTKALLVEATRLRLQADVPVGALLSGGVDSSLVCWAVAHLGADITAFTVGTPGDPVDETSDAVATARRIGLKHEIVPLSAERIPSLQELVDAYGEPFACASALGMLRVCEAVRASATVLLTGDGGDDVFLGYPQHRHFLWSQRIARALPGPAASLWRSTRELALSAPPLRRPAHFLDYATGGMGAVTAALDGLPFYQRNGILGERLREAKVAEREISWSLASARALLPEYLRYEQDHRFVGEYMTKVDGAAMYFALEARSPFLDQEVWNFAAALPHSIRLHRGRLKSILRELARRVVGDSVARGRKRGFSIPVERWLVGKWRTQVEESFENSVLGKQGWLRSAGLLDAFRSAVRRGTATNHLWYCYVLECWLRGRQGT
ncbi:MAG: asparagine synthase (glutamine-hydrolyzing) [Bryobacteraceae bacterium]